MYCYSSVIAALGALLVSVGGSGSLPLDMSEGLAFTSGDGAVAMTVQSAESSWEDGVIVTRLSLRGTDSENTTHDVTVKALGGQVGELVQVVGHALPPRVGDSLRIRLGAVGGGSVWVAPVTGQH